MQGRLRAQACGAWLLLALVDFVCGAAAGGTRLRARPDYITDPGDKAWLAHGDATRILEDTSGAVASAEADRARAAAAGIRRSTVQSKGAEIETQAQESLQQALVINKQVQALLPGVEQKAYAAGRVAAESEVRRLAAEAKGYFGTLKAQFDDLAQPQVDPKVEALRAAAQPYYDEELRLKTLVKHYSEQAVTAVAQAQRLAASAHAIAAKAGNEQEVNQTYMAHAHMNQAQSTIVAAAERQDLARGIQRLAESMNAALPGYQQAQQMALDHTLATFSEQQ